MDHYILLISFLWNFLIYFKQADILVQFLINTNEQFPYIGKITLIYIGLLISFIAQ